MYRNRWKRQVLCLHCERSVRLQRRVNAEVAEDKEAFLFNITAAVFSILQRSGFPLRDCRGKRSDLHFKDVAGGSLHAWDPYYL